MKPIYCIDVTADKRNRVINGSEFITNTLSSERKNALDSGRDKMEGIINRSKLPAPITIISSICGLYAFIVLIGILRADRDPAFGSIIDQTMANAPWLLISGAVCGIVWLTFFVVGKLKQRSVLDTENAEQEASLLEGNVNAALTELGVPDCAIPTDVLQFIYKIKDGVPVAKTVGLQLTPYHPFEAMVYTRDGYIHFADIKNVYSFELSSLKRIRTVKKRIAIEGWNKEIEPSADMYKPYKLKTDQYGNVHIKEYHVLEIEHFGRLYGIYFPSYELPIIERLTGLKAETV